MLNSDAPAEIPNSPEKIATPHIIRPVAEGPVGSGFQRSSRRNQALVKSYRCSFQDGSYRIQK